MSERLSDKSAAVLAMIGQGQSYSQIVDSRPDISYLDIFAAADEALRILRLPSDYEARIAAVKREHSRAYERWTEEEDNELAGLQAEGESIEVMAHHLGRQPSAVRSRLDKQALDKQRTGMER